VKGRRSLAVLAAAVVVVLLLAGCGASSERAQGPPAPQRYLVLVGPTPGWLESVRPHGHGRWINALPSPDGETLLAQWLSECETPIAYFVPVASRRARPVASPRNGAPVESVVVGWTAGGRARVFFPAGVCGSGDERPGLYVVALDGKREFVTADWPR
jgi:hypothetical protein